MNKGKATKRFALSVRGHSIPTIKLQAATEYWANETYMPTLPTMMNTWAKDILRENETAHPFNNLKEFRRARMAWCVFYTMLSVYF